MVAKNRVLSSQGQPQPSNSLSRERDDVANDKTSKTVCEVTPSPGPVSDWKRALSPIPVVGLTTTTSSSLTSIPVSHTRPYVTDAPVSELETLEYEAGMLFRTLQILTKEANRLDELALKNALTEDAVLHTRSLCGAFLEDNSWPDDIRL